MSPADALARLSELLPLRIQAEGGSEGWVFQYMARRGHAWEVVWWGGDTPQDGDTAFLEYALREEVESRGWRWTINKTIAEYCRAIIDLDPDSYRHSFTATANTPAQALLLATIAALEAQHGN